jgi:hypothetical protein
MWEGPLCPDSRGAKAAPTLKKRRFYSAKKVSSNSVDNQW